MEMIAIMMMKTMMTMMMVCPWMSLRKNPKNRASPVRRKKRARKMRIAGMIKTLGMKSLMINLRSKKKIRKRVNLRIVGMMRTPVKKS
jgi:hypothetical protein